MPGSASMVLLADTLRAAAPLSCRLLKILSSLRFVRLHGCFFLSCVGRVMDETLTLRILAAASPF